MAPKQTWRPKPVPKPKAAPPHISDAVVIGQSSTGGTGDAPPADVTEQNSPNPQVVPTPVWFAQRLSQPPSDVSMQLLLDVGAPNQVQTGFTHGEKKW